MKDTWRDIAIRHNLIFIDEATLDETRKTMCTICSVHPPFLCKLGANPVVPGGILLEVMCEAAALYILFYEKDIVITVANCKEVRWLQPVHDGDRLEVVATLVSREKRLRRFACKIEVAGVLAACAEVSFFEKKGDRKK